MPEIEQKFKKGDKVRLIKYAHPIWISKKGYPESDQIGRKIQKEFDNLMWFGEEKEEDLPEINLEAKPKNIISENEDTWVIDLNPINGWINYKIKQLDEILEDIKYYNKNIIISKDYISLEYEKEKFIKFKKLC